VEQKVLGLRWRASSWAFAALVLILAAPVHGTPGFWDDDLDTADFVASMTDEELLGQVLMLGYLGSEPTDEFLEWIGDWNVGGVKIFGWNTGDLEGLARGVGAMQKVAVSKRMDIPLFVATDQEGGWVRHVKGPTSISAGNLAIGASGIALDAYQSGNIIGQELRVLGINMNFAPTVDIYTNPEAHVIGPRSFSADPVEAAFLSVAYYHGLEDTGVIATAKHYPGHGNADQDSHGTLPVIRDGFDTIWESDLLPYRLLIKEGLAAVMSGHLNFPLITGNAEPTSLSPTVLKDILRDKMHFGGVVITDDMKMYGVRQGDRTIPEVCELALRAGNDMIMISRPPSVQIEVRNHLLEVLADDRGFRAALEESVERIVAVKRRYLLSGGREALYPDPARVHVDLPNSDGESFFFDLACRSTTLIRDNRLPVDTTASERVLLVGQYSEFFAEGTSRFRHAGSFALGTGDATNVEARNLQAAAESYDTLIFCLSNERTLRTLQMLEPLREKIIVLSVLTPIYLRFTPWVGTAVAVYGTGMESFKAGFAAIAGDFIPQGLLPIPLPGE
jgi:beta-N-acetylhexosaminidase